MVPHPRLVICVAVEIVAGNERRLARCQRGGKPGRTNNRGDFFHRAAS
jgi:hypothetical protein